MSRLFVTGREQQFVNDVVKEYVKDILGQWIFYYPVSVARTQTHDIYQEAPYKIFDNPIQLDAMVSEEEFEAQNTQFGTEYSVNLDAFVQHRDLVDKNIKISEGDFFVYAGQAYEILSVIQMGDQFGQAEHVTGYKIQGRSARIPQIDPVTGLLPTTVTAGGHDANGVPGQWQQQRGLQENSEGVTGDVREMRKRLGDDLPEPALGEGPRTVATEPAPTEPSETEASSFYNE